MRAQLESILRAALAAAEPGAAVARALRLQGDRLSAGEVEVELGGGRVWVVGAGKAAAGMAAAALALLGERVAGGVVCVPDGLARPLGGVEVWEASHPLPDARGLAAAAEALHLARRAGEGDLLLCLLSGGASALWPAPAEGLGLEDLREVTAALLRAGAPIAEVNAVRKHLSVLAGGQLARLAAPARVLTLAVSDVIGADAAVIGSGPTLPDPTTFAQALEVILRREVAAPPPVLHRLQAGAAGDLPETPGAGELENVVGFQVVASLRDALAGAAEEAGRLGYAPEVVSDALQGEAREVGVRLARALLDAAGARRGPRALLWGGETTVTVRGAGRGGRSQELALAAATVLAGEPNLLLAAFGTDGRDGPTPAAGAAVDGGTLERGRAAGRDADGALADNDSHAFLAASGDLLVTGPTGTNVNDLVVGLVG